MSVFNGSVQYDHGGFFYLQDYEYKRKIFLPMVYRLYAAPFSLGYYLREGDTMRSTKELRSARAAIFIGAILTVLAAAAIFFVMHMGDNKNLSERNGRRWHRRFIFQIHRKISRSERRKSIVNNDPDHAVSIHHPVFGIQAIDLQVLEVVEDLQKGHREQLGQEQQTTTTDVQSDLLVDYNPIWSGSDCLHGTSR